jgi:hypothetical protein
MTDTNGYDPEIGFVGTAATAAVGILSRIGKRLSKTKIGKKIKAGIGKKVKKIAKKVKKRVAARKGKSVKSKATKAAAVTEKKPINAGTMPR